MPGTAHSQETRMSTKAEKIVAGLGGIDNIEEIEGCVTRLRTEVVDPGRVDETALKAAGAHGVVKMGTAVQVVVGTDADPIAAEIERLL
ncbi:PTS glucose/sucrose transporter subunit IIB [Actinacidiphila yeochonensis]|uniref:PTS glucose/sucrose transporter subunit IIB n=1 Tax=Actinacidiphila yeochonensis TaxID=89050 RepID=UPI002244F5BB|nr:PTS glucose/sucrose transporter subunit IIB [Actinacidiphila yeochonensis]